MTTGYLLAAGVGAASTGNREFLFYSGLVLAVALFVAYLHYRFVLPTSLLISLCVLGAMHMAGGLLPVPRDWHIAGDEPVLYSLWLIPHYFRWDHLVHGFGYGLATWLFWRYLAGINQISRPKLGHMVVCAAASMGLGAMNEVMEMAAKAALEETNVGGYWNTAWDLTANAGGAVLGASVIWALGRSRVEQP